MIKFLRKFKISRSKFLQTLLLIILLHQDKVNAKIIQTSSLIPIEFEIKNSNFESIIFIEMDDCLFSFEEEALNCNNAKLFYDCVKELQAKGIIELKKNWIKNLNAKSDLILNEDQKRWVNIVRLIDNKELCILFFARTGKIIPNWSSALKKYEISKKGEVVFYREFYELLKNLEKKEYKKLIVISANPKLLEVLEKLSLENKKEFIGFHYTYLKVKPKLDLNTIRMKVKKMFEQKHEKINS